MGPVRRGGCAPQLRFRKAIECINMLMFVGNCTNWGIASAGDAICVEFATTAGSLVVVVAVSRSTFSQSATSSVRHAGTSSRKTSADTPSEYSSKERCGRVSQRTWMTTLRHCVDAQRGNYQTHVRCQLCKSNRYSTSRC